MSVISGLESWTGALDWSTDGLEYWSALLVGSEDNGYRLISMYSESARNFEGGSRGSTDEWGEGGQC